MSLIEHGPDRVKRLLAAGAYGWVVFGEEGPVCLYEDEAIEEASGLNDISEKYRLRCPYWVEWIWPDADYAPARKS